MNKTDQCKKTPAVFLKYKRKEMQLKKTKKTKGKA